MKLVRPRLPIQRIVILVVLGQAGFSFTRQFEARGSKHQARLSADLDWQAPMLYHLHQLNPHDRAIVWEMLMYAAHESSLEAVKQNPELTLYAEDWGRAGDLGVGAFVGAQPIGAGWVRLWSGERKGYGYVANDIPELALAVAPDYRGQGIGSQILQEIIDRAKLIYPAISLSVREDNPAIRMYERLGFRAINDSDKLNRVGTRSFNMLLEF